jgi:hypothetical protein
VDDVSVIGDIEDRADCERLVRAFYARALVDPLIRWIFVDVARRARRVRDGVAAVVFVELVFIAVPHGRGAVAGAIVAGFLLAQLVAWLQQRKLCTYGDGIPMQPAGGPDGLGPPIAARGHSEQHGSLAAGGSVRRRSPAGCAIDCPPLLGRPADEVAALQ